MDAFEQQIKDMKKLRAAVRADINDFDNRVMPDKYDRVAALKRLMASVDTLAKTVEKHLEDCVMRNPR